MWTNARSAAAASDDADELAGLREHYNLPSGVLRFNGSSGGPLPSGMPARLRRFVEDRWDARGGQPGPDDDQYAEARLAAAELAPLIGVDADEIALTESTSMNLFRALLAAAHLRPERPLLALGRECFANDHYLARSAAEFTGRELRVLTDADQLSEVLREGAAIVAVSHVDIASGSIRDPLALTAEAHRHGCLVLWDLSHSAGALHVDLHTWDADFAIGCGYRFLGGGAGAPAYSFVAKRHHAALAEQHGVLRDTTSALTISELRASLSILDGVSPKILEKKTTRLIEIFGQRLQERGLPAGLRYVEPQTPHGRGSHRCLRHPHAQYLARGLLSRGIVVDFVEPDLVRFSFAPAWLRYADACAAADALCDAAEEIAFRS